MPWTYEDFLKNTNDKGFTEKDIEIIKAFRELDKTVVFAHPDYVVDFGDREMPENEKQKHNDAIENLLKYSLLADHDPTSFTKDMEEVRSDPKDEKNAGKYENAGQNAIEFINNIAQPYYLENYLDCAVFRLGNDENKTVDTYFNFVELMNRCYGANIDVKAQRERYESHVKARQRNDERKADRIAAEQAAELKETASASYRNGKLYLRGSEQYKDIGTAFDEVVAEMRNTDRSLKTLNAPGREPGELDKLTAVLTLSESLKKIEKLLTATDTYLEYKRNDPRPGQWHNDSDQIANKSARARVLAAKNMQSFANHMKAMYNNKLVKLQEEMQNNAEMGNEENIIIDPNIIENEEEIIRASDREDIIINAPKQEENIIIDEPKDDAELNVSRLEIVADKEDKLVPAKEAPAFSDAVKAEREKMGTVYLSKIYNDDLTPDELTDITNTLATVIVTSVIFKKNKNMSTAELQKQKIAHKKDIKEISDNIGKLVENKTLSREGFQEFSDKVYAANGTALTMQYAQLMKPAVNKDTAKVETKVVKKPTGKTLG